MPQVLGARTLVLGSVTNETDTGAGGTRHPLGYRTPSSQLIFCRFAKARINQILYFNRKVRVRINTISDH